MKYDVVSITLGDRKTVMKITSEEVKGLVENAFDAAWENRNNTIENHERSSYFVSQLSEAFANKFKGEALVQKVDKNGKKASGEWLLDIAIVSKKEVSTSYKNRSAKIVDKIIWAIESEFSTNLNEFCKDFAKLIHIKSEAYLYIAGLNQPSDKQDDYINAQIKLAKELVGVHEIKEPFYLVFVPTSGRTRDHRSIWDKYGFEDLKSWIHIENLSFKI